VSEKELLAALEAGRRAWPNLDVPADAFARHLTECANDRPIEALEAADLYLACACVHSLEGSVETFLRAFTGPVLTMMKKRGASAHDADELMQRMRAKLFCAKAGARPKIAEYAGRAPLRSWVATIVTREMVTLQREAKRDRDREAVLAEAVTESAAAGDAEAQYLKARYRAEFETAAKEAIESLSDKQRTLLWLHFGNGFTVDRLASVYRIGRSTAARWLAGARGALRKETKRALCARLRITGSDYQSLCALIRSELNMSIGRLLT
jgi:RNA polymerase sigma-70 factor (ECF subfamily)